STTSSPAVTFAGACAAAPEVAPSAAITTLTIHPLQPCMVPPVAAMRRKAARIRRPVGADQAEAKRHEAHHHGRLGPARAAGRGAVAREDRAAGSDRHDAHAGCAALAC